MPNKKYVNPHHVVYVNHISYRPTEKRIETNDLVYSRATGHVGTCTLADEFAVAISFGMLTIVLARDAYTYDNYKKLAISLPEYMN